MEREHSAEVKLASPLHSFLSVKTTSKTPPKDYVLFKKR